MRMVQRYRVVRPLPGTEADSARPEIDGKPLSRCNFIITGFFDEADAHMIAGQRYDAYISVYLKPDAPSNKANKGRIKNKGDEALNFH